MSNVTVGEALEDARRKLAAVHGESASLDARWLLESLLRCDAAWLLAHGDDPLESSLTDRFEAMVARREAGEPVAYITGVVGFYGYTYSATPATLIPRPETEQLVELALDFLKATGRPHPEFCDVGTGSGVIAITIAMRTNASCVAIDISPTALEQAKRSARWFKVDEQISFRVGDLLKATPAGERFDCIAANLPYIPTGDLRPSPDPTSFEPVLALDGGPDGLDLYRRLFEDLEAHVDPGAAVFLEAGPDSTQPLARLAVTAFPAATVSVHRDYAGHLRIVEIRFP